MILRCMESDPDSRPGSAYEVVAALPGGDPLAAMLQAGETPPDGSARRGHQVGRRDVDRHRLPGGNRLAQSSS